MAEIGPLSSTINETVRRFGTLISSNVPLNSDSVAPLI